MVVRVAAPGAAGVVLAALGAALAVCSASTEQPRPAERAATLELTRAPTARPIVRPEADLGLAARDAAKAAAEYEQQRRDEAIMRQQTRPAFQRPDLGYDVTSGIQQRNLRR